MACFVSNRVSSQLEIHRFSTNCSAAYASGMSYSGARTISELQTNAEFIRITSAGLGESIAHGASKKE